MTTLFIHDIIVPKENNKLKLVIVQKLKKQLVTKKTNC